MSTTLPTTPTHPASFSPPRSALVHLCWKELKQVIPAHIAIVCVAVVVIFAVPLFPDMAVYLIGGNQSPILLWNTINVLSAVVCAAVFYGMDRENGSWAWQSSLPVSWQLSAGSRLLTAGSIFLVVAFCGWPLIDRVLFDRPGQYDFGTSMLLGGIFWLQTYCVFAIVLMLVGDILWALVLAASLAITIQAFLPLPTTEVAGDLLAFIRADSEIVFWRVGILMAVQVLLLGIMVSVHAWRWNHGCYSDVADGLRKRFQIANVLPTISFRYMCGAGAQSQPGRIRSLLWLSMRQYFLARLSIVVVSIWIMFGVYWDPKMFGVSNNWTSAFAIGSLVFLGVSVFGGDQARKRYAAVSSRGVSPELFWFQKMLLPTLVAILAGAALVAPVLYQHREGLFFLFLGFGIMLFLASQFCGLCFRSTVTAVIVTVIASWLFAVAIYLGFWAMPLEMGMEPLTPFWMLALGAFGLVLASLWCCRRWFVMDSPRLVRPFSWVASAYLVLALLMGAGTKYLAIPGVAWKGGTHASVPACIERLTKTTSDSHVIHLSEAGSVSSGISGATSELIALHFQWIAQQKWLANPVQFEMQLRYTAVAELKPLNKEELESVTKDIRSSLEWQNRFFSEVLERSPPATFDLRLMDSELMNSAAFCLEQKLWPEAETLLAGMGKIRTNPILRVELGRKLAFRNNVMGADFASYIGPEQITALGGPGEVRDMLRPLYFSADEASTFVSDILTTLRFNFLDEPAMVRALGVKSVRGYMGYGHTTNSMSNWLLPHLDAKLAAAHLETQMNAIHKIWEQASVVRGHQSKPASISEVPIQFSNYYWADIPYTDNSAMANMICASATSLAANWETRISPLLDQMEQDQKKQASGQVSGEKD